MTAAFRSEAIVLEAWLMAGEIVEITTRPRPTIAAVKTTQSTVTAPESSARKDLRMFNSFMGLFLALVGIRPAGWSGLALNPIRYLRFTRGTWPFNRVCNLVVGGPFSEQRIHVDEKF